MVICKAGICRTEDVRLYLQCSGSWCPGGRTAGRGWTAKGWDRVTVSKVGRGAQGGTLDCSVGATKGQGVQGGRGMVRRG